jgi:hypothetical protein
MDKHTPGPWTVERVAKTDGAADVDGEWFVTTNSGDRADVLAIVTGGLEEDGDALSNARLIAAAPRMLEMLGELIDAHERFYGRHIEDAVRRGDASAEEGDMIQRARAILRELEG